MERCLERIEKEKLHENESQCPWKQQLSSWWSFVCWYLYWNCSWRWRSLVEVLLVLCFLVVLLVVAGVVCEVAPIVFPSVGGVSPHQVGFSGSPHSPRINVSVGQNIYPPASHAPSCTLTQKLTACSHCCTHSPCPSYQSWCPLWLPMPLLLILLLPVVSNIVNPLCCWCSIHSGILHAPTLPVYPGFLSAPILLVSHMLPFHLPLKSTLVLPKVNPSFQWLPFHLPPCCTLPFLVQVLLCLLPFQPGRILLN